MVYNIFIIDVKIHTLVKIKKNQNIFQNKYFISELSVILLVKLEAISIIVCMRFYQLCFQIIFV